MRTLIRVLLGVVILGSLLTLWASIYPGVLSDLLFLGLLLAVPCSPFLLLAGGLIACKLQRLTEQGRMDEVPSFELSAILFVFILTLTLLVIGLPMRVAFAYSRGAFESIDGAVVESTKDRVLNQRLGLYYVDKFARDPRGGAYFRVGTTSSP